MTNCLSTEIPKRRGVVTRLNYTRYPLDYGAVEPLIYLKIDMSHLINFPSTLSGSFGAHFDISKSARSFKRRRWGIPRLCVAWAFSLNYWFDYPYPAIYSSLNLRKRARSSDRWTASFSLWTFRIPGLRLWKSLFVSFAGTYNNTIHRISWPYIRILLSLFNGKRRKGNKV